MLIRRETPADVAAIRAVHSAAFAKTTPPGQVPVEVGLVDALRAGDAWLPELSLVAQRDGEIAGHVVCTRGHVAETPVLALGPIGVPPQLQGQGVGAALMHAVLGGGDALGEPMVVLLGHLDYYPMFGFEPAETYGITPPVPDWGSHFQVRALASYRPSIRGEFRYAEPFMQL
ncbi:GNAT family N-acetyltransferase [Saccharopolyspora sp. 5N708]|uniref:GNAT family N-acetyltransferase n=1 Tax=Saccharopolyspora sp. 5N708 TaxID=3457424 RepID=UPI003FCF5FE3